MFGSTIRPSPMMQPASMKRALVTIFEEEKEPKSPIQRSQLIAEGRPGDTPFYHSLTGQGKPSVAMGKNRVISLHVVEYLSSPIDQKDARNCPYHRRKGRMLEECVTFKMIFYEKHKAREVLFQDGGAVRIKELPFPKHHERGKGQK